MSLIERVLYRDGLMLVLDKPAGLNCTPTGPGQHLTAHLQELTFGKTTLPQVAHRLDRETTGCLLLGRHAAALRKLADLFSQRKIVKVYWAIVRGLWDLPETIDQPLEGKPALTEVRPLQQGPDWTWLELRPLTGRTRQLRLHCSHRGHPIVGDDGKGPLMLHARSLEVPLYPKRPPVRVEAPLPPTWSDYPSLA